MTDLSQSYLAQVEPVTAPPIDWGAMTPLLIVLGAACVAVLVEAFLPRHQRWPVQVGLSVAALGLAGLTLGLYTGSEPAGITTIGDALTIDQPTLFLWGTLLALGLGSVLLMADRSSSREARSWRRRPPVRPQVARMESPTTRRTRTARTARRTRRRRCRPRSSRSRCSRSAG